jgi:hypothetical protein
VCAVVCAAGALLNLSVPLSSSGLASLLPLLFNAPVGINMDENSRVGG